MQSKKSVFLNEEWSTSQYKYIKTEHAVDKGQWRKKLWEKTLVNEIFMYPFAKARFLNTLIIPLHTVVLSFNVNVNVI